MTTEHFEPLMRIGEVARRLDVSVSTAYLLVKSGQLKCHRVGIGRGSIRVAEGQLAEYLGGSPVPVVAPPPVRPYKLKHFKIP